MRAVGHLHHDLHAALEMGVEGAERLLDAAVGLGRAQDHAALGGLLEFEPLTRGPALEILREDAAPVAGAFGKRLEAFRCMKQVRPLGGHAAVLGLLGLRRLAGGQKRDRKPAAVLDELDEALDGGRIGRIVRREPFGKKQHVGQRLLSLGVAFARDVEEPVGLPVRFRVLQFLPLS